MTDATHALPGFGDFDGHTWLNTAHQGALPAAAADAARDAIAWKVAPFELTSARFTGVPARLRAALGRLIGVAPGDVILGNSASYGLHLVASAYPWRAGDEAIVVEGDFPSNILPWLLAGRRHGVAVVRLRPRGRVVDPDELLAAITPRTRVFCTTWVHSFSGFTVDLDALGTICRDRGVTFVVNGSQAIGARPIAAAECPIDALASVGHKWLCGPYGTGFLWLRPDLRDRLRPTKAYWLSMSTADDLGGEPGPVAIEDGLGARAYDVFGTANFFNFVPLAAAVEHLSSLGLEQIAAHDQTLVSQFVERLDREAFTITSPTAPGPGRSTLVFFSHRDRRRNHGIHRALSDAGIHLAYRAGSLRLSPHLYNHAGDIARLLDALAATR